MNKQGEMESKYSISRLSALKNTYGIYIINIPFTEITFGKHTLARLLKKIKVLLEETGIDVSNNQE